MQREFVSNSRLRDRDDLAVHAVQLQRAVGAEMGRVTPDPKSGEVSNTLASLPPGSLAAGDNFEASLPRTQWASLIDKFADRTRVALALLTAVKS